MFKVIVVEISNKKNLKFEYQSNDSGREIKNIYINDIVYEEFQGEKDWIIHGFDIEKKGNNSFALKNIQRIIDIEPQRFLCVTVYVVNEDKKLLMILHNKLNKWVPPGGKLDNHETPDEAAIRECLEETGIDIELCGEKHDFDESLITPIGSQCNTIKPGIRDHVDLIYLGKPKNSDSKLLLSQREGSAIGWFNLEEINNLNTFDSVKYWAKKLLK